MTLAARTALSVCVGFALCAPAIATPVVPPSASVVQVSITLDDPIIDVGQTTTLRLAAEVIDGVPTQGIAGYALDVIFETPGLAAMAGVTQLGSPDLSGPGTIDSDGLHQVWGRDGGFFFDMDRGIGTPYELLNIEIFGVAPGIAQLVAGAADVQNSGIPPAEGFILHGTSGVTPNFGGGVSLTVVPEPTTLALLALTGGILAARRPRRQQ